AEDVLRELADADDAQLVTAKPDRAPERLAVVEQLPGDRSRAEGDRAGGGDGGGAEVPAADQRPASGGPTADARGGAMDGGEPPGFGAGVAAEAAVQDGGADRIQLLAPPDLLDRDGIVVHPRRAAAVAHDPDVVEVEARAHEVLRPRRLDRLQDAPADPGDDRADRDHGRHPDDDAEDRQGRPELVGAELVDRELHPFEETLYAHDSLVAERDDRVELGRSRRGVEPGDDPDAGAEHDRHHDPDGRDRGGERRDGVHDLGERDPYPDPDQGAEAREGRRFDQDLDDDVAPTRADRLAHPDLARPLHDGHEHDVHDDHPADDERDPHQRREGEVEDATDARPERHGVVGGDEGEVVGLVRPQPVPNAHDRLDLHEGLRHVLGVVDADQDVVHDAV